MRSREPVTAPEAAARRSPGPIKAHRPARAVSVRNARTSAWAVVRATAAQAWADRVFGLAAEAGFWALLSLTPLLLVLVAAVGYLTPLFGAHLVVELEKDMLHGAGHFMAPAAVQQVLTPVLTDVLQHGRGGIISLSFPLALWTGSTAMNTYVNTITISYGMRHVRSAVRARLVAFGLYLGALVAGVAALPLLVTAPRWIADVAPGPVLSVLRPVVAIAYWPVLVVVCTGLLATLYHVAVPVRGRWRRDLPGAIAAMLMWLASSLLLRAYLAFAIGHSPTYGALSAPVAILLFLYVSALAVLLGGELNAQIASCRAAPPSRDMLSVPARRLDERGPARDGAPHDQLVDLPRPLVGVDRLGVGEVACHAVLQQDAVPPEHLPGQGHGFPHAAGRHRLASAECSSRSTPASWSWASRTTSARTEVRLPSMVARWSWTSWNPAMGRPDCSRSVA